MVRLHLGPRLRQLTLARYPDVGGGNWTDEVKHSLNRIPLRWMIRECFKMDTGIRFHGELLKRIGMDPRSLHPYVTPRPPPVDPAPDHLTSEAAPAPISTEEDHEVRDALAPASDALSAAPGWWVLEFLPMKERTQGPGPQHKEHRTLTYVFHSPPTPSVLHCIVRGSRPLQGQHGSRPPRS